MPVWAFMFALVGGSIGLGIFSLQTFQSVASSRSFES